MPAVALAQPDLARTATGSMLPPPIGSMTQSAAHDLHIPDEPTASSALTLGTVSTGGTQAVHADATGFAETTLKAIVRLPDPNATPASYSFDMRGQWEGTVQSVDEKEFTVVLRDLMTPGSDEYDATFSTEEVSDEDLDLLQEGAILYWTIGYRVIKGQRLRVSEIRFRRLPAWSRGDLARMESAATEFDELFAG